MNVTPNRLEKIKPILEESLSHLAETGNNDPGLERKLRDLLNTGYQSLKPLMVQLAEKPHFDRYRLVALRYMESDSPGPVSEFKPTLAKAYNLTHYEVDRRLLQVAKDVFWENQLPKLKPVKKRAAK